MWIKSLSVHGVRSFESIAIEFSKSVNVLIGPNNSGKSTILRALTLIQPFEAEGEFTQQFTKRFGRIGQKECNVRVNLCEPNKKQINAFPTSDFKGREQIEFHFAHGSQSIMVNPGQDVPFGGSLCNPRGPNHFLFPFFSRRKPTEFDEHGDVHRTFVIEETLRNVYAKIDAISNASFPEHQEFRKLCGLIFGFEISCQPSRGGRQAGLAVSREDHIPIDSMGEGTVHLLGFIAEVLIAEGKVFLIEELENDIHPKALKVLLDLIVRKSETNQFIISTHSNIVAKYAGAASGAKIFGFSMTIKSRIPTSTVSPVPNTPEARIKVLEDLGYDLFDFELWKAYLILEESSAERMVNDILIPLFVPKLAGKLKTIAASGNSDVERRFHDFLRLFVYVHTSSPYKNRAWVGIDGGHDGPAIVGKLRKEFSDWPEQHFRVFNESDFEKYYPAEFQEAVTAILQKPKAEKRGEKRLLLQQVIEWSKADHERARNEFSKSAGEIIEFLVEIEKSLNNL